MAPTTNDWQSDTRGLWRQAPGERLKLALGRMLFPGPTRAWLSYLHADRLLWAQAQRFPKLVTRIYRPYALRNLGASQRVEHMIEHYQALSQLGFRSLLEQSVEAPFKLADVAGKQGTEAELRLISVHEAHREGEAHVQLHWNGQRLYSLSFLLRRRHGACQMLVTRLQGSDQPHARDMVREATRGLHGLRPAALLVQVARQIGSSLGCTQVLLVSHQLRVALNPVRRWKLPRNLEPLWLELGAQPRADGLFEISPVVQVPNDFSGVSSSKRAEARRKAELLERTLTQVRERLAPLQRTDGGP